MGDRVGEEDSGKGILKSGQKGAKQSAVKFEDITAEIGVMRRSSLDLTKPRLAAREVAQGLANLRRQAGVKVTVSAARTLLAKGVDLMSPAVPESQRRVFIMSEGVELALRAIEEFSDDQEAVAEGCALVTQCFILVGGSARCSGDLLATALSRLKPAMSPENDSVLELLSFLIHDSPVGTGHYSPPDSPESDDSESEGASTSSVSTGCLATLIRRSKRRGEGGRGLRQSGVFRLPSPILQAMREEPLGPHLCSLAELEQSPHPSCLEHTLSLLSTSLLALPRIDGHDEGERLIRRSLTAAVRHAASDEKPAAVHERALEVLAAIGRRPEPEARALLDSQEVLDAVARCISALPRECRGIQRSVSRVIRAMASDETRRDEKLELASNLNLKVCLRRLRS